MQAQPRHRIDHVGSLVRPPELLAAYDQLEDGTLSREAFQQILSHSITQAVRLQEGLGLPLITDGEFSRRSGLRGFLAATSGLELRRSPFSQRNAAGDTAPMPAIHATGRLQRKRAIVADDIGALRVLTRHSVKATLPSPSFCHFGLFDRCLAPGVYADMAEFETDLIALYRLEMTELVAAGCQVLQLDDIALAMLCDPEIQARLRKQEIDPPWLIGHYVRLIQAVCRAAPAGLRLMLHLCRGNQGGMWAASGSYEPVAYQIFNNISAEAYLLEFDSTRAGNFAPLRHLPRDKMVFLGLVSTKEATLETRDQLRGQLSEAARYISLDRIGLSPQCGFASSAPRGGGFALAAETQRFKLQILADLANEIWGGLTDSYQRP
jgi:5-methyltetrahydropteroyltriglutamate--homocysteine methyltransferase